MSNGFVDSPHEKSMKFLKDVCRLDGIDLLQTSKIYKIIIRIRGRSGRHYEVIASRELGLFSQVPWEITVTGAARKNDFGSERTLSYTASLCLDIHEEKRHLPIGDRLASLALSLHNDVKLAMDIPLIAQFIVCPREQLYHVYMFQDDMVVTQDIIDQQQDFDEVCDMFDEEDMDAFDEFDFLDEDLFEDATEDAFLEEKGEGNWVQDFADMIMQHFERDKRKS